MPVTLEITGIAIVIIALTGGLIRVAVSVNKRFTDNDKKFIEILDALKANETEHDAIDDKFKAGDNRYEKARTEFSDKVIEIKDLINEGFKIMSERLEKHELSNESTDLMFKQFQIKISELNERTVRFEKIEELTNKNTVHIAVLTEQIETSTKNQDKLLEKFDKYLFPKHNN